MKRLTLITLFIQLFTVSLFAQNADFKRAVARYASAKTVTAAVTKTTHKNAVARDVVSKGTLTMKAPSEVSIVMEGGKDQLLMKGSDFTMVVNGKRHTTSSKSNPQFASFQAVFESILAGGTKDISRLGDLSISKQGSTLVLTITPKADPKKAARRMMFSSFVLTIDTNSSALRSLRLNDRSGYTEYKFTGHQFK